jgi:hypothetical protein
MNLVHEIFDVFGFIVALVGLTNMYARGEMNRKLLVVAIGLLLTGLGVVVAYEYLDHRSSVQKNQIGIIRLLGSGPKTQEELASGLEIGKRDLPLLWEAIDRVEESGDVDSERYTLSQPDSSASHAVRLFQRVVPQNRK